MPLNAADITLVRGAIHNPSEPRHFMRVVPLTDSVVTIRVGATEVGRSRRALEVREVARDIYEPVLYLPRADLDMGLLRPNPRTTHCPLKGDTAYFDIVTDDTSVPEAAWSYVEVIEAAAILRDLVAFDRRKVEIVRERAR